MNVRSLPFVTCLAGLVSVGSTAVGQEAIQIRENLTAGYQYHVSNRVEMNGTMTLPAPMAKEGQPKVLAVSGNSLIEYDERVLTLDGNGQVSKTLRQYSRMDFKRKLGEQSQESRLRPQVARMVLLRLRQVEVPFSPDGPLTWGEIDQVRTDVFTPALAGLYPGRAVRVGEQWPVSAEAARELTDLDELSEGRFECRLQEILIRNGRKYAQVSVFGTVSGTNEDGPNRQQLDGYYIFDLQSNHLSYLYLQGTSWLLDKDKKPVGKIEGHYVLTRRLAAKGPLGDEALRHLKLDPDPENTQLLFHEPAFGVQFIYSRRWTVRKADARQIMLDEPGGGGLLLTLEPLAQTPTGSQFQDEVAKWLQKQSARIMRSEPPRPLAAGTMDLHRFSYQVELDKQPLHLEYYVGRQSAGGFTAAGRFPVKEADALKSEAEQLVRSLKLVPPK